MGRVDHTRLGCVSGVHDSGVPIPGCQIGEGSPEGTCSNDSNFALLHFSEVYLLRGVSYNINNG